MPLRYAQPEDSAVLAGLIYQFVLFHEFPCSPGLANAFIEERLNKKDSVILVFTCTDDVPIAFGNCYRYPHVRKGADCILLNDLFVSPDSRRTGAASQILSAVEAIPNRSFLTLCTAKTNDTAQRCYTKNGWSLTSDVYYQAEKEFQHQEWPTDSSMDGISVAIMTKWASGSDTVEVISASGNSYHENASEFLKTSLLSLGVQYDPGTFIESLDNAPSDRRPTTFVVVTEKSSTVGVANIAHTFSGKLVPAVSADILLSPGSRDSVWHGLLFGIEEVCHRNRTVRSRVSVEGHLREEFSGPALKWAYSESAFLHYDKV